MNKKVYILTILVFVMAINAVFSQTTTKKLSYQAVVRNAANELVVNQNLSVEITILNANNVPQYKETHATVPTNQNGLLWLWVGDGTPTLGTMDNVVWKDATIKSVFTLPDGSTVEQNTPVTAMPYAYFADEVDTIFLQDYLTTHNYGNDDYVTHQELNDTLNHYYTNEQVDAALIPYATNAHLNDTLSHYLMKEVQVLSISHDTIFLTGGSFVVLPKGFSGSYHDLVDTPTNVSAFNNDAGYLTEHQSLEGYVTNDKLKDTLNSYYTKGNVDTKLNDYEKKSELCGDVKECIKDTLAAYYDTTRTQSVISDTATALRAMMGDAANDGIITIDVSGGTIENPTFSVNQANNQTVKITIPEAIPAEDGQLTIIAAGDTTRFTANQATNDTVRLNKFATKDTLAAYYDTTHTKDVISDTATALRAMMVDAANDGQLTIIAAGDTTRFTANQATNDTMRLNKFATKDTLAAYYDTADVKQMLKPYLKANELCDSIVKCDVIKDIRDSLDNAFDTLKYYTTTNQIDTLLDAYATTEDLALYELQENLCKDVKTCIKDTLGKYTTTDKIDTLLRAYYDTTHTKSVISDTATALRAMMGDAAYNAKITLKKNNVDLDSFRLNQQTDKAINIPVPTTVAELSDASNYVTKTKLNDTLGAYYDTANVKQMLKPYLKANELCDSIVKCDVIKDMRDSLGNAFDTLKYYYTSKKINDTLKHYYDTAYVNQTLKQYLKSGDLCDSIEKNCTNVALKNKDNLFTYRNQFDSTVFFKNETQFDSIAYFNERTYFDKDVNIDGDVIFKGYNYYYDVNNFYEHGAIVLIDEAVNPNTLGPVQSTQDQNLNRRLAVNYNDLMVVYDTLKKTAQNGNAALAARIVADSNRLVEFKGKVHNDSLALAERIDTIYRHLCDSVMNCTDIKTMQTDIAANKTNIGLNKQAIIDSSAHIRNDIKNGQITIAVNRSTATTETTVTNPTFGVNQEADQTVTINIPQETTVNNGQLTIVAAGDTTRFTANQATNDTVRLDKFATKEALKDTAKTLRGIICDSATACITKALADPTSEINYAIDTIALHHISDSTRMVFDTLHKYYAKKDTLKNFVNKLAIRDSVNKIVTDSLRKGPSEMTRAIDSIARHHISDSTRMVFDTLHKYYATKDTLKNFVNKLAIRDSVNKIVTDSLRKGPSEMTRAIDSIARHHISDSTRMVFDTLHKYYATKDTLKNFVNKLAIRDSVNKVVTDSLRKGPSEMTRAIDSIARHHISDSTRMVFDTLHKYYATKDTLKNFVNKLAIRDSVNNIVKDSLAAPNSAINIAIDTIARHNISDSTRMVFDTLHNYYATKDTLKNFVNKLAIRDSVNNIVKDSLAAPNSAINIAIDTIARHNISDSTRMVFDTLHTYYATKDTLKNFVNKLAIRDSVNKVVTDSLRKGPSEMTRAIDSIARHHVSDSTRMVFDTLHTYYATKKALKDTATAIRNDICDSATTCITKALADANSEINHAIDTIARHNIHDTAVTIRNSIGNGQITIQKNGATITDGSFNLNQKTDQTINITVPTQTSELTNNSNLAYTTGNTFSGTHDFTASGTTITVPSNEGAIKRPVPTTTPAPECTNMNAVNVCDLLAVFDSLTKRIDALQQELDELKSATPPDVSVSVDEAKSNSIRVTATANGHGAAITSYVFCISENSDMSSPIACSAPISENNYTFNTGIYGNRNYYVTAKATNMVGSTTSTAKLAHTPAHKPTATVTDASFSQVATGFQVVVTDIDPKEKTDATEVIVRYKLKGETDCPSDGYDDSHSESIAANISTNTQTITGLTPETDYCVMVEVTNGDSTAVMGPFTVHTGIAITFVITPDENTVGLCGNSSVEVTYTATPSNGAENYSYSWNGGPATASNTFNASYSVTGSHTVTCEATHTTGAYTLTATATTTVVEGTAASLGICEEQTNGSVTVKNTNCTSFSWKKSSDETEVSNSPSGLSVSESIPAGVYSVTATNNDGCSVTKEVLLGDVVLRPCTVTTAHTDVNVYPNNGGVGGYETETSVGSNIITHVTDQDGNNYRVVKIGSQCWMAENLRTKHCYYGSDRVEITSVTTSHYYGAHFKYPNNNSSYSNMYGLLYNYGSYSTNSTFSYCPKGWHIPTDDEFHNMEQTVNEASFTPTVGGVAGSHAGKLSSGCSWTSNNVANSPGDYNNPSRNSSYFSALPAGNCQDNNFSFGSRACYWTSTKVTVQSNYEYVWHRNILEDYAGVQRYRVTVGANATTQHYFSIRCVRNDE